MCLSKYGMSSIDSSSPIHFCDNTMQTDDGNVMHGSTLCSTSRSLSAEDADMPVYASADTPAYSNQLTTDSCTSKNSKRRRMEYSMRGMKTCSSSNPSQDSAFGSMTDGELSIASSSIRMSSFQSISSPIDEGVEDSATGLPGPQLTQPSSPCKELHQMIKCKLTQSASETSLTRKWSPRNIAGGGSYSIGNANAVNQSAAAFHQSGAITLDPPKILVNDKNSVYTTSPSRTSSTISQKYRVCSFEDMSLRKAKNMNRHAFRSLEEERRIDSAFTPVDKHQVSVDWTRQYSFNASQPSVKNAEKIKKLTHSTFTRKTSTTKERHSMWKNSILARKKNLIKSNESLHDQTGGHAMGQCMRSARHLPSTSSLGSTNAFQKRVNSTNELHLSHCVDVDRTFAMDELCINPRKSHSERYLLSLAKSKQAGAMDNNEKEEGDADDDNEDDEHAIDCWEIKSFIDDTSSSNSTDSPSSSTSSPCHREICQFIGGIELSDSRVTDEKVPLLDGMEMSPISPVDTDALL